MRKKSNACAIWAASQPPWWERPQEYLTSRQVRGEVLLAEDGEPLTIGRVKGLINLWLAELGAENPEGTIFAIGRDAGVPHSSGNPADVSCAWARRLSMISFPAKQAAGITMILPVPGASVTRLTKRSSCMKKYATVYQNSDPSSNETW